MASMLPENPANADLKRVQDGRISIVIVTYNAAATLQACLESIYNQRYNDIEIIVIDGKSTDGTVEILGRNTSRIAFWKSEKDTGVYDAMNKGITHITGQWVYFMGADDELLPGFSDMADELRDPAAIYYGNVFAEGTKRLGELTRYQFAKYGPYHQAMIYPNAVFQHYKFDARYDISGDFALTLQLCGDKSFRFVYRDYVLANFNDQGLSGKQVDTLFQSEKAGLVFANFGLVTWLRCKIHKFKNRHNPLS